MIQDEMNLSKALDEDRKTGQECICDGHGVKISTVQEYWQWAYSSLLSNTERGNFAEYLVAVALGVADKTRISWDKYDLISPGGVTVEVKASGYLQTWGQDKLTMPEFSIKPTKAWDYKTNQYDDISKRQAEVYVFCVHNYKCKDDGLNPLDLGQWEFYVLSTKILDENVPSQKRISLEKVKALGAVSTRFNELKDVIEHCLAR
ncbi:hypothetical protein [Anaerovibrio lipolyticus]|uniref:hypothetical protein n=1 Tax=Anaerovibrio lipolyticus TaxID=82374 RepID=UPI0026EFDB5E|nr:hypothetical protein [Anaerovibrio lipolyticus]MBE6106020.1 hypothetical protein [Anaerovibrio lipolyticus]